MNTVVASFVFCEQEENLQDESLIRAAVTRVTHSRTGDDALSQSEVAFEYRAPVRPRARIRVLRCCGTLHQGVKIPGLTLASFIDSNRSLSAEAQRRGLGASEAVRAPASRRPPTLE